MKTLIVLLFPLAVFAQTSALAPVPIQQPLSNSGLILPGGCLYIYAAGTTTPQNTWSDAALSSLNPQPIVLSAFGRSPAIYQTVSLKMVLGQKSLGVCPATPGTVLWSQDNVFDAALILKTNLATSAGAGLSGLSQSSTYPAATVGKKLQQFINIADAPYNATTASSDNTGAYNSAMAALSANGGTLYIPAGTFKGHFVFPQYPKSVRILCAGQDSTILQADAVNTPVFSWPNISGNFTSGINEIANCSVKAHVSGSTGAAIDMRGSNRAYIHDINFLSNAGGDFAIGFLCNDTLDVNRQACYSNTVERVNVNIQTGPATLILVSGTSGANHFRDITAAGNTSAMTAMVWVKDGANANDFTGLLCDGNPGITCVQPGINNTFINVQCEDGFTACVTGDGGGNDTFINLSISGVDLKISCPFREPNWTFLNPQIANLSTYLAALSPPCINPSIINGGAVWNQSTGSSLGGATASQLTGGALASCVGISTTSSLTAGTYHYVMTTVNSAGETSGATVSCTIANGQGVNFNPTPNPGDTHYKIYGRQCPTAATCQLIAEQDATSSSEQGLNIFDSGQSAISATSPPSRNSTGDVNGFFRSRWNNAGVTNDVAECLTVIAAGGHCPTVSANNDIRACQNGVVTGGTTTTCDSVTAGFFPGEWFDGYEVQIYSNYSLQVGANFFTLESNRAAIKSCQNPANDIAVAIAAGTRIKLLWIAGGAVPLNVWCLEGQ